MRKLLILCVLLFASTVSAEVIPPGCYVADYYRTDSCWVPYDNYYNWTQSTQLQTAYYGANAAAIEANRQEWIAYGNAQKRLASKLRKKCGNACKNIK